VGVVVGGEEGSPGWFGGEGRPPVCAEGGRRCGWAGPPEGRLEISCVCWGCGAAVEKCCRRPRPLGGGETLEERRGVWALWWGCVSRQTCVGRGGGAPLVVGGPPGECCVGGSAGFGAEVGERWPGGGVFGGGPAVVAAERGGGWELCRAEGSVC